MPGIILNGNGEHVLSCLSPDLGGKNFYLFLLMLNNNLVLGLSYVMFIMLSFCFLSMICQEVVL